MLKTFWMALVWVISSMATKESNVSNHIQKLVKKQLWISFESTHHYSEKITIQFSRLSVTTVSLKWALLFSENGWIHE